MDYEVLASEIAHRAKRAGADEADVFLQVGTEFNVQVRKGEIETLTQAGSKGLGLRLFVEQRQGFAATSDFSDAAIERLITSTVALAQVADRREENGLANTKPLTLPDLQLYDPKVETVSTETKIELAKRCEAAAFAHDSRISNSEGAGFGSGTTRTILANSAGFVGSYQSSGCSLYCQPLAEADGKKQVDYEWTYARSFDALDDAETVGRIAAERVLRKLGARKVETQKAPVVFDRRVAGRIWASVLAAVDGDSVFKGMSYLKGRLGEKIAADCVTLVDDGLRIGGAGSAPFDGDGLPTRRKAILERGVLKTYLYDTATARKAGAASTGNARRSTGGVPHIGCFNIILEGGDLSPEAIFREIGNGFLVTSMMGGGANPVTGDFSIGASGLWIVDGEIAFSVDEVTIAGTMDGILQGVERIGNDLRFQSSVVSPTFQVAEMTVGGR